MATGFHGAHVLIGTIFLIVCLVRAYAGHFTPTQHLGFEFAAWYWHFVDVVWLFLFACIYVWGGGTRRCITEARCHNSLRKGRPQAAPFALCKHDVMTPRQRHDRLSPIRTGLACRCPRCGKGRLFQGFLTCGRAARTAASITASPTPATARRCSSS